MSTAAVITLKGGLQVREATADDYLDVLRINPDIYQGMDYMPEGYLYFLSDPNRMMVVYLINEKIVGMQMAYMVNDGDTVIAESSRLKPELQAQGYAAQFNPAYMQFLRHKHPNFRCGSFIVSDRIAIHTKRSQQCKGLSHMYPCTMIFLRCMMAVKDVALQRIASSTQHENGALHLSQREALMCLNEPANHDRLFPHKRILLQWESFKLLPSNFKRIVGKSDVILGTPDCDVDDFATNFTFNTVLPNLEDYTSGKTTTHFPLRALSISMCVQVQGRNHYTFYFYGRRMDDLFDHICKQTQRLRALLRQEALMYDINYSKIPEMDDETILRTINGFGAHFAKLDDVCVIETGPLMSLM